ncbi:MAG: nitrite/sulfite reductase, partial [Microbacteriaceae bacterium]|nr:nitrite/sulfite reductase [Burkholderiaceae bacterium]
HNPQAEFNRIPASFARPVGVVATSAVAVSALVADALATAAPLGRDGTSLAFTRWLQRNVHAHQVPGYKAVTLSLKRPELPPGDATDVQMDAAAALSTRFSQGELRVSHDQNLVLPWVREADLGALFEAARAAGFATPNIGLITDMINCPGGDFCALANARPIPVAPATSERFADLDEVYDIGDIDLHISGCINSCGHHHSGHIGILGVDKDGSEWFQVSLGGSDGSTLSGAAVAGKVIGPSFAAEEVADVVEAVIDTYTAQRLAGERFINTVRRIGIPPFKAAADAQRHITGHTAGQTAASATAV